jgi:MFS family permease
VHINNPFVSLRHRSYRYYALGMLVSQIGTWMQNIAQPWLAYRLTGSPLQLSLVGALQFLPVLLFSLPVGVLIDKFPRKRIILITQAASLLITLTLAILTLTGRIRYGHLLVMASLLGLVNTLDVPTRQTFVVELVGRDDLMNAIALNSTTFNLSRVLGPAIAGLIMAYLGVAYCFLINAISFAAVLISFIWIHPLPAPRAAKPKGRVWSELCQGLRYIRSQPVVIEILVLIAIIATFIPNFGVLVPVFASDILHLSEASFGFLMMFLGLGSFIGAITVASISRLGPNRQILRYGPLLAGVCMILIGTSTSFAGAALFLAATGLVFVTLTANANSTIQLHVPDAYRGRVMSTYALLMGGSTPLGNLYAGTLSEHFGARVGFWACGSIVLLLLGVRLLIRLIRKPGPGSL